MNWPTTKQQLADLGILEVSKFCTINNLPIPKIEFFGVKDWFVSVCAYYRSEIGIKICLTRCQQPCTQEQARNFSWPANIVDREPFGVLLHELGHHVDWCLSKTKYRWFGDLCTTIKNEAKEPGITSYAETNAAEWFAEAFRLFVTNPTLLKLFRPKTYKLLSNRLKQTTEEDWKIRIGDNCPKKVIKAIQNKIGVNK